jgi:hypothetical protein
MEHTAGLLMIDLNGQPLCVLTEVLDYLVPVELEAMRLLERLRPDPPRLLPSVKGIDCDTLRLTTSEIIEPPADAIPSGCPQSFCCFWWPDRFEDVQG